MERPTVSENRATKKALLVFNANAGHGCCDRSVVSSCSQRYETKARPTLTKLGASSTKPKQSRPKNREGEWMRASSCANTNDNSDTIAKLKAV